MRVWVVLHSTRKPCHVLTLSVLWCSWSRIHPILNQKRVRDSLYPSCPYVFFREGKKIGDPRKSWTSACERAGLAGKFLRDCRRTAVRNMIRSGIPDLVAMKISGHKTRSVFDRYNATSEEDVKDACEKMSTAYDQARKKLDGHNPDMIELKNRG
jgi:hypothetical protein